jgi:hypothetical protein
MDDGLAVSGLMAVDPGVSVGRRRFSGRTSYFGGSGAKKRRREFNELVLRAFLPGRS